MTNISLVSASKHKDFADNVAEFLSQQGYSPHTNDYPGGKWPHFRTVTQYVSNANLCNVLFLSIELLQNERDFVSMFHDALQNDQYNIILISLDDDWTKIPGEKYDLLKSISYISYYDFSDPMGLAKSILTRAKEAASLTSSHMDRGAFEALLSASYDEITLVESQKSSEFSIDYSVHDCCHRASGEWERYIALYPGTSFERVSEHISSNKPSILGKDTVFVVRSHPRSELSVRQKADLSRQFGGRPLRFETMVKQRNLRRGPISRLFGADEFIVPQRWSVGNAPNSQASTDQIVQLLETEYSNGEQRKIVIVSGAGGGGKTHFARFFHDKLASSTDRDVFFLSANSVLDIANNISIGSLFDVYQSCMQVEGAKPLDKDVFEVKFLVENPVVIIDGLEEMITSLGDRFDTERFFLDCISKADSGANGSVVITTREAEAPTTLDQYVHNFKLSLFDQAAAQLFFDRFFHDDSKRNRLANRVFEGIVGHDEGSPPIFCDLIARELQASSDADLAGYSNDLSRFESSDGLYKFLGTIILREQKLGVPWDANQTLERLGDLSQLCTTGPVALDVAVELFSDCVAKSYQPKIRAAIRNFVFLQYSESTNSLTFRYEFLRTVLLAKHIVRTISSLSLEQIFDKSGYEVFATLLTPGSDVMSRIIKAERGLDLENFNMSVEEIIKEFVSGTRQISISDRRKQIIISNLLYLRFNMGVESPDHQNNLEIVKEIFLSDGGVLRGLSLFNFSRDEHSQVKFDLRGLLLESCNFENLDFGKSILVDGETRFSNCRFAQCRAKNLSVKHSLWSATFDQNCEFDKDFNEALASSKKKMEKTKEAKIAELQRFFRCFSRGHDLTRYRHIDILTGMFSSRLGLGPSDVVQILEESGVLENPPSKGPAFWRISESNETHVRRFLFDKITSGLIDSVIAKM